jgi:histidinol phosphatase-like enzyme
VQPVKEKKNELYTMKIIFLDCDGVLNCSTNSFKAGSRDMFNEKDEYPIE